VIIEDRIREWEAGRCSSGLFCPAANSVAQFSAILTSVAPQENPSASQRNSIRRAIQPIPSHKTRCGERETWQIKSPNSGIKIRPNSLKTNDGEMLKSPKNQKMRALPPPVSWRMDSSFSGLLSPRASAVLLPQIRKWSRPLLIDSALPIEFGLTYRKQTTEEFLTDARTHISETRICAKISVETTEKTNEEMSAGISKMKAIQ
jgi:hypothetical protein